jgi:arsenite-transporting ATPase
VVGVEALANIGQVTYKERSPGEVLYRGAVQEIIKVDGEYILRMPLPNVEVDKVLMTKKGDELIVEIGNFKRDMLLPHSLAQRSAKGARFKDGVLQVHFN